MCIYATGPAVWVGFSVERSEKGVKPHIMKDDVFVYAIDGATCA